MPFLAMRVILKIMSTQSPKLYHAVVLIVLVLGLGYLALRSWNADAPLMPGSKIPEAPGPQITEVQTPAPQAPESQTVAPSAQQPSH